MTAQMVGGTDQLYLKVDAQRCQGHNRCWALAPNLVELDAEGRARVTGSGLIPPALERQARLLEANCPEGAVQLHRAR